MHACGRLFSDAMNPLEHLGIFLVQHGGQVATIIENHVRFPGLTVLQNGLLDTPLVLWLCLALPCENRNTPGSNGGGGMILSGENIAA